MSTHRFILEPYKGIATRHTCPECHKKRSFARYIDTEGKIEFPPYVGRCNHEQSCGYHFTPKDFFEKNPEKNETFTKDDTISYKKREMLKPLPTSYIDENIMRSSQKCYEANNLFLFLSSQFGETATLSLMEKYHVGTSKHWTGATVFWQVDNQGKVRTGKVMLYYPETGKRVKEPYNHISWVHSLIPHKDFHLCQCFFGEHLINAAKTKPIALVESEKTAQPQIQDKEHSDRQQGDGTRGFLLHKILSLFHKNSLPAAHAAGSSAHKLCYCIGFLPFRQVNR